MRGQPTRVVAGAVIVLASVASVAARGGADGPGQPEDFSKRALAALDAAPAPAN